MRLLLIGLFLMAGAAFAEPAELHVAGEIAPALKTIDQRVMRGYTHHRITHITFHHEGFAGTDAALFAKASRARKRQSLTERVLNINHYHATAAGLGMIAYHYVVAPDGKIAKARPVKYKPATMSTKWGSSQRADFAGHFAVMALGDFNHEVLTEEARLSMVKVMSEAQRAYRVPTHLIQPHRTHANTSCPGETMLQQAEDLAQRVVIYGIQSELAARSCGGTPEGVAGPDTMRALKSLSEVSGFDVSGGLGDALLFALLEAPERRCK